MPYLCVERARVRLGPIANTRSRLGLILGNSQHDLCNAENDDAVAHVQDIKSEQGVAQASDPSVRGRWSLVVVLRIAPSLRPRCWGCSEDRSGG